MDGIGWSDKLTGLMLTGSCILLEQSGYRPFFGRQLRPFVHYVPFWKTRPQARCTIPVVLFFGWSRSRQEWQGGRPPAAR